MHPIVTRALIFALALVVPSVSAAQNTPRPTTRTLLVDWAHRDERSLREVLTQYRMAEGDTLRVRVQHMNFLRFQVGLKAESVELQAYTKGEGLWNAIFSIASVFGTASTPAAAGEPPFRAAYRNWYREVVAAQATLTPFTTQPVYALEAFDISTEAGKKAETDIATAAKAVTGHVSQLAKLRAAALDVASSREDFQDYEKLAQIHDALLPRLGDFSARAQLVSNGQLLTVPTQKSGRLVTLTMTSQDRATSNDVSSLAVTYFVRSRHPLVFHTGYAVSELDKLSFDKVSGLAGQDLYATVSSATATSDLVSYLSYEFWNAGPNGRYGTLATIGVPVTAPTSGVTVGGSIRVFSRLLFNVGLFVARVDEGVGPVEEPIVGTSGSRTVYTGVKTRFDFAGSYSVSFRVY